MQAILRVLILNVFMLFPFFKGYAQQNLLSLYPINLGKLTGRIEHKVNNRFTAGSYITAYYMNFYKGARVEPVVRYYFKKNAFFGKYIQLSSCLGYYSAYLNYKNENELFENTILKKKNFFSGGLGISFGSQYISKKFNIPIDWSIGIRLTNYPLKNTIVQDGSTYSTSQNDISYFITGPGSVLQFLFFGIGVPLSQPQDDFPQAILDGERKGYIGLSLGPSVPLFDLGTSNIRFIEQATLSFGYNYNYTFAYIFKNNIGLHAKLGSGEFNVLTDNFDKAMVRTTNLLAGPVYSIPYKNIRIDNYFIIGLAGLMYDEIKTMDIIVQSEKAALGIGYNIGSQIRYRFCYKYAFTAGVDYMFSYLEKYNVENPVDIDLHLLQFSFGLAYCFR